MTVSDGLAAVGAYGILVLVLDSFMKNISKVECEPVLAKNGVAFIYGFLSNSGHIVGPLLGLWMLTARVINILLMSELMAVPLWQNEFVFFFVILLLTVPLLKPALATFDRIFWINKASTSNAVGIGAFLMLWLSARNISAFLPLAGLWVLLFSCEIYASAKKTRVAVALAWAIKITYTTVGAYLLMR